MKQFPLTYLYLFLLLGWASTIAWLSLGSPPSVDLGLLTWDKLLHAGAYGLLMLLALLYVSGFCLIDLSRGLLCWFAVVVYGGLLEVAQMMLTQHRTAEWWDLVADGVGAALVLIIGLMVQRRLWTN